MIQAIFFIALAYVGITGIWVQTEKIIYGKSTPRLIDDIVAIVLAISLYFNVY